MTTRLSARYQTITHQARERLAELLTNRDRGDGIQYAVIIVGGLLVALALVAAFTAAINSRISQIK
ncbi:hypothetical protein [Intrasporangium sp.]|uniref:hypothetical protein n=1 Tax=Intrasporangium sp. TaxID=1925024 RepID=UPI0032216A80